MSRKAVQTVVGALMLLVWGIWGAYGIPTARLDSLVNYPNPFDPRQTVTFIVYSLKQDTQVHVRLFDLLGYIVREWQFPAGQPGAQQGQNKLTWDGTDETGDKVAAGGYICQVVVAEEQGSVQGIRKIGVIR